MTHLLLRQLLRTRGCGRRDLIFLFLRLCLGSLRLTCFILLELEKKKLGFPGCHLMCKHIRGGKCDEPIAIAMVMDQRGESQRRRRPPGQQRRRF